MGIQTGDVIGDYKVIGLLGRGGMGKVFRVRSLLTDREDAMKVLLSDLDHNPDFEGRFLREIKVHASLQHPNIAALYTAHRIGDRVIMILELVEGVSLEEMLRPEGMDIGHATTYILQALDALAYAHDRGVVHRDLKPANIMIASGGVVKLTDFGIASSAAQARLTGAGLALGTLAYMSPEQIEGRNIDGRSDIYSLGLTYYEMITGRRAIQAPTDHGLLNAQLNTIPPAPAVLNPGIPARISDAIVRALKKEPARRFQSAREFHSALSGSSSSGSLPRCEPPHSEQSTTAALLAPELAELEKRLSRSIGPIAKHIVADAARRYGTILEIRRALAAQIENPKERETFLKGAPATTATTIAQSPAQTATFETGTLDRLTQALAPYLGPIAKMVVIRAARSSHSIEELRSAAAAEIDSSADRRRFLESTRSI
jgi:serine/threonine-protein kinase